MILTHGSRTLFTALATGCLVLSACGGGPTQDAASSATADGRTVLPVSTNPIANTSTIEALRIDSVLVENNVDPTSGKDASDHLEIALTNTGTEQLTSFEVFYTITDPTTGDSESYYAKLPDTFTIGADSGRVVHFDGAGTTDHLPVNKFSLYYTDKNALEVTVLVSASDAATQTLSVKKDAGDAEEAD
jgi:hypothetical protein